MAKYNARHCFTVGGNFNEAEFTAVEERAAEYAGGAALTNEHYAAAASDILQETKQLLKQLMNAMESQYPAESEVSTEPMMSQFRPVEVADETTAQEAPTKSEEQQLAEDETFQAKYKSLQADVVRYTRLAEDLDAQTKFLEDGAKKQGFTDVEDMLEKDYDAFVSLASEWRQQHPEEVMYSRTDTPEFKEFFDGSKVVDAQGKPLMMYHYTEKDFDTFDTTRQAIGGEGSWFSSTPNGDPRGVQDGSNTMPVYLSLQNPKIITHRMPDDVLKQQFIEQGYDGAIILHPSGDGSIKTAVAFYPTQIKSATGNNGSFSATNPDIRYSRAETLHPELQALGVTPDMVKWFKQAEAMLVKDPDIQRDPYVVPAGVKAAYSRANGKIYRAMTEAGINPGVAMMRMNHIKNYFGIDALTSPAAPSSRYSRTGKPQTKAEVTQLLTTGKVPYSLSEAFRRDQMAEALHLAKDKNERKAVAKSIGDSLINTFADSLIPVRNWINKSAMSDTLKQRLTGDLYRADTQRSYLEKEVITQFTDPMFKEIEKIAKQTKMSTDAVKRIAGYWMSAKYAPEANQRLIEKDRAALAAAQKGGDAAKIAEAQMNLNLRIADVNGAIGTPIVRGVAGGLNNAEAAKNKRDAEAKIDPQLLEAVAKHVYAMLEWKKQMDIKEGKVTQQTVNGWLNSPNYVPLTGDPRAAGDFQDVFNTGNRINQQKDYAMEGRKDSIADDGIDASVTAVLKSINHASFQDFKRTLNEAYETAQAQGVDIGVQRTAISGLQRISDEAVMYRDTQTSLKGLQSTKGYSFKFTDPSVMPALKKANQETVSKALSWIARGTSLYARLVTQFMPMFAPINFLRDIWERTEIARIKKLYKADGTMLTEKQMDALARRGLSYTINPAAWKATIDKSFKRNGMSGMRPDLEELIRLGGMSTWGGYLSRTGSDIEDSIRKGTSIVHKTAVIPANMMEAYSNSFEMVPSLALFKAAKDMGVAPKDAAAFVLDLMNFRKKGTVMPTVKAFYVFAQPAAQSGYNMSQYLSTKKGQRRFAAYVLGATALYAMMAAAWGDEDDEELGNKLDNMSNFITDRTIPIKVGDKMVKVPVGFGPPQLAWLFGTAVNRLQSGRYDTKDALLESIKGAVKSFAPVSPSEIEITKRPVAFLFQTFTPTLLKPLTNIAMDQTGLGGALTPQFKNPEKMRYEQAKRNTPGLYPEIAKGLYDTFGVDMYPDHVKALMDGVLIGPARTLMQMFVDNPAAEFRGDVPTIPGVSQMVDNLKPRAQQTSIYYRVRDNLEQANKEVNRLKTEDATLITPELRQKAAAYKAFQNSELALAAQRTALKKAKNLDDETRSARLQAIEEKADAAQRKVLLRYAELTQ